MSYDPESGLLVCDYCLNRITVKEYQAKEAAKAEERAVSKEEAAFYESPEAEPEKEAYAPVFETAKERPADTWQAYVYTCPQCGGRLLAYEETAATFCSFCGASVILQSRISDERKPDAVIPFTKTKEDCEKAYRKMLKRAVFIPNEMKKTEEIERFRGIYMPYWVYSFSQGGPVVTRGQTSKRAGDYIITDHYELTAHPEFDFKGISFDASSSFADNLSEAIAPFRFEDSSEFNPAYLSGFYADASDIDSEAYLYDAMDLACEFASSKMAGSKPYRSHGVSRGEIERNIRLKESEPKLAFFPVWFLASRNKKGDRVSYAVINGQTGKAAAELPVDWKKLIIGTLILALPVFLILNFALSLTPLTLTVCNLILAIAALVIANRQMNQVYIYENRLNDKGYWMRTGWESAVGENKKSEKKGTARGIFIAAAIVIIIAAAFISTGLAELLCIIAVILFFMFSKKRKKENNKGKKKKHSVAAPMKQKIKVLIKPIAGIVLAILVTVISPVYDAYYYAAAVISTVLIAWSFIDIIGMHNTLSSRPLPQFKKRGGDDLGKN